MINTKHNKHPTQNASDSYVVAGVFFCRVYRRLGLPYEESVVQIIKRYIVSIGHTMNYRNMFEMEITKRLVVDRQYQRTTVVRVQIVPFLLVQTRVEME